MLGSLGGGPEPLSVCSLFPLGLGFTCRRRYWGPACPQPPGVAFLEPSFPEAASFRKTGTWAEKLSHWLRICHRVRSGQACTPEGGGRPLTATPTLPGRACEEGARAVSEDRPLLLAELVQEGPGTHRCSSLPLARRARFSRELKGLSCGLLAQLGPGRPLAGGTRCCFSSRTEAFLGGPSGAQGSGRLSGWDEGLQG